MRMLTVPAILPPVFPILLRVIGLALTTTFSTFVPFLRRSLFYSCIACRCRHTGISVDRSRNLCHSQHIFHHQLEPPPSCGCPIMPPKQIIALPKRKRSHTDNDQRFPSKSWQPGFQPAGNPSATWHKPSIVLLSGAAVVTSQSNNGDKLSSCQATGWSLMSIPTHDTTSNDALPLPDASSISGYSSRQEEPAWMPVCIRVDRRLTHSSRWPFIPLEIDCEMSRLAFRCLKHYLPHITSVALKITCLMAGLPPSDDPYCMVPRCDLLGMELPAETSSVSPQVEIFFIFHEHPEYGNLEVYITSAPPEDSTEFDVLGSVAVSLPEVRTIRFDNCWSSGVSWPLGCNCNLTGTLRNGHVSVRLVNLKKFFTVAETCSVKLQAVLFPTTLIPPEIWAQIFSCLEDRVDFEKTKTKCQSGGNIIDTRDKHLRAISLVNRDFRDVALMCRRFIDGRIARPIALGGYKELTAQSVLQYPKEDFLDPWVMLTNAIQTSPMLQILDMDCGPPPHQGPKQYLSNDSKSQLSNGSGMSPLYKAIRSHSHIEDISFSGGWDLWESLLCCPQDLKELSWRGHRASSSKATHPSLRDYISKLYPCQINSIQSIVIWDLPISDDSEVVRLICKSQDEPGSEDYYYFGHTVRLINIMPTTPDVCKCNLVATPSLASCNIHRLVYLITQLGQKSQEIYLNTDPPFKIQVRPQDQSMPTDLNWNWQYDILKGCVTHAIALKKFHLDGGMEGTNWVGPQSIRTLLLLPGLSNLHLHWCIRFDYADLFETVSQMDHNRFVKYQHISLSVGFGQNGWNGLDNCHLALTTKMREPVMFSLTNTDDQVYGCNCVEEEGLDHNSVLSRAKRIPLSSFIPLRNSPPSDPAI